MDDDKIIELALPYKHFEYGETFWDFSDEELIAFARSVIGAAKAEQTIESTMTYVEWLESTQQQLFAQMDNELSAEVLDETLRSCWNAAQQAEQEKYQELIAAAEAIIDRWDRYGIVIGAGPMEKMLRDVLERMKTNG